MEDELNVSTLESLLASCASITETALSYHSRTASASVNFAGADAADNMDESMVDALIAHEHVIAKWLDRQIVDHKALLENDGNPKSSRNNHKTRIRHHQQLVNASARLQLEHTLLSRIQMSQTAQAAFESNDSTIGQAAKSRNAMVDATIRTFEQWGDVKRQIRTVDEECRRLQEENRKEWNVLNRKKSPPVEAVPAVDEDETSRIRQENKALQQLTIDLLAAGGLDWYNAERLRAIMLEEE